MGVKDRDSIPLPAEAEKSRRLRGRALRLTHFAWWLTFGGIVVLTLVALPMNLEYYHGPCHTAPCVPAQLTPQQIQNWLALGLTLDFYAAYIVTLILVTTATHLLVALIIFLRKPNDAFALFVSFAFVIFGGATFPPISDILSQANPLWWFPTRLLVYVGRSSTLAFFYLFPSGEFVPRWTRVAIVLVAVAAAPGVFFTGTAVRMPADWLDLVLLAAVFSSGIFAQLYRYRRVSSATERQQTKWVVFGVTIGLGGFVTLFAFDFFFSQPADNILFSLIVSTMLVVSVTLIPVSIGIAILHSRLWDIDLLINRTLVYVPLTAILAGLFAASITLSQKLFLALTGQQSDVTTVITTLLVVAAFTPIKDRLQALVDKRFKELPDPAKKLKAFEEQVRIRLYPIGVMQGTRRLLEEAVAAFEAKGGVAYLVSDGNLQLIHTAGEWNGDAKLSVSLASSENGAKLGVVALGARRNGAPYREQDCEVLQHLAQVVAQAIEQDQSPVRARLSSEERA